MRFRSITISGEDDPRTITPEMNFGAGGLSRRVVETAGEYSDSEVVWQQDVYEWAASLDLGVARVVDLGTGSGIKTTQFFDQSQHEIVQVDFRDARSQTDGLKVPFIELDFSTAQGTSKLKKLFEDPKPTLFLLADVIEHLRDPRPLLRSLRWLLRRNEKNRLVISTPDRERVDGRDSEARPDNPRHFRQWTANEFGLALRSSGLKIIEFGRVPQNNFDDLYGGIAALVSCDYAFLESFLLTQGLPSHADHILVTSEFGELGASGGIGSYCSDVRAVSPEPPLILIAGGYGFSTDDVIEEAQGAGLVHVDKFAPGQGSVEVDRDRILTAVQQLLFLYDDVKLIEFQDYLGIGARIAQAKRAQLIPTDVLIACYAHGNQFYLDCAGDDVNVNRAVDVDAWERIALQEADVVLFPSRYLEELYIADFGLDLRDTRFVPYPGWMDRPARLDDSYQATDTVLFYGRPSAQKGYPEFIEALSLVLGGPHSSRVRNVVLLGVPEPPDWLLRLEGVDVHFGTYDREGARRLLSEWAGRALAVLPYKGDNQPLAIWEVVESGARLISFDAGGVPEQLPRALHEDLLCSPNVNALASKISEVLAESYWDTVQIALKTRSLIDEELHAVRDAYLTEMSHLKRIDPSPHLETQGSVSVVFTNYNGKKEWIKDAFYGITNSFARPSSVILVDDDSDPVSLVALADIAERYLDPSIPYQLVRPESNQGLAGARNLGMKYVESDYVLIHDNDNIVRNDFIGRASAILDADPRVGVVTCWTDYFADDGVSEWNQEAWPAWGYRPLGGDLGIAFTRNCIGDAGALYRVEALHQVGFWDASSRAKWEDWQTFLQLLLRDWRVQVLPEESLIYRVRPDSMLRTYGEFRGWERIWRSLPVPQSQRYSLLRQILHPARIVAPRDQGEQAFWMSKELREQEQELALQGQQLALQQAQIDELHAKLGEVGTELQVTHNSRVWKVAELLRGLRRK